MDSPKMPLPSHYLITPAATNEIEFLSNLELSLQAGIKLLQFKGKQMKPDAYRALAKKVLAIAHAYDCRVLLTSSPEEVAQLGADGLHLSSHCLDRYTHRPLPEPYLIAASGHNINALNKAQSLEASFALISPIKYTESHPDLPPLGWEGFASLTNQFILPIFALGGVSPADEAKAITAGGQGIAGTRGYWKRTSPE